MLHYIMLAACTLLLSASTAYAGDVAPKNDEEKTFYALGVELSRQLVFSLSERETELLLQGVKDGVNKTHDIKDMREFIPKFQELARSRMDALADAEENAAKGFLKEAGKADGAEVSDSGLIYSVIKEGTGKQPKATDKVSVHYHGTLRDGTVFDSSVERGSPASFPLNGVIPCWTEGVQKMKVGGKSKLVCPAKIAYGSRGRPPKIKPGAPLVFEVELLEIVE